MEKICRQQYKMADAVLLAYRDYLKGDEYLESADYGSIFAELEKLNYQMLSKAEIKSRYNIDFDRKLYDECSSRKFRKYMQPLMYGHLIPGIFCRKITITDVLSDRKEHYFRADRVLHYDLSSETGYVTEKSLTKAVRLIFGINNLFKRFSEEKK